MTFRNGQLIAPVPASVGTRSKKSNYGMGRRMRVGPHPADELIFSLRTGRDGVDYRTDGLASQHRPTATVPHARSLFLYSQV